MKIALVKVEHSDGFPLAWYGVQIGQVFTVEPVKQPFNIDGYPVSMYRVIAGDNQGDHILPSHCTVIKEISACGDVPTRAQVSTPNCKVS